MPHGIHFFAACFTYCRPLNNTGDCMYIALEINNMRVVTTYIHTCNEKGVHCIDEVLE